MNQEGPDSGPGPSTRRTTHALKSELALAVLHLSHGLLGRFLGFKFSHHFHARFHLGASTCSSMDPAYPSAPSHSRRPIARPY